MEATPDDATKLNTFKIRYANFSKVIQDHLEIVQEIISTKQLLKLNDSLDYSFADALNELTDFIQYVFGIFDSDSSSNSTSTFSEPPRRDTIKLNMSKFSLLT